MRLIVQKYGGTSVATPERILKVAERLIETQREGCRVVAVISAMAGVTDNLIKLAREVLTSPPSASWMCCSQPVNTLPSRLWPWR